MVCGFGIRFILLISKKKKWKKKNPLGKALLSAFWHKSFRELLLTRPHWFCPLTSTLLLSSRHKVLHPKAFLTCNWFAPPPGEKKKKSTVSWRRTRQVEEPEATKENMIQTVCSHRLAILVRGDKEHHNQNGKSSLKSLHSEIQHTFVCLFVFPFIRSFHAA